jgi:hypothetical protein
VTSKLCRLTSVHLFGPTINNEPIHNHADRSRIRERQMFNTSKDDGLVAGADDAVHAVVDVDHRAADFLEKCGLRICM